MTLPYLEEASVLAGVLGKQGLVVDPGCVEVRVYVLAHDALLLERSHVTAQASLAAHVPGRVVQGLLDLRERMRENFTMKPRCPYRMLLTPQDLTFLATMAMLFWKIFITSS